MRFDKPHRRWNPLRQEWILNSPQRMDRPWQGKVEPMPSLMTRAYDPECYLCPGNIRAGGIRNPQYSDVFAFTNDYPAILPDEVPSDSFLAAAEIVRAENARGICRVLCFSPRHDLTLAHMEPRQIARVLRLWQEEYEALMSQAFIAHVMTFENKGEMMGTSNPHPHCQIWATSYVPTIPNKELEAQREYYAAHREPLLMDYLRWELDQRERIVTANEYWVTLVPFWAGWPFELLILPRQSHGSVLELSEDELRAWAEIMKETLVRYDNLFRAPFPYSMGLFQAPRGVAGQQGFTLHQTFLPPLLRSATVRKFMVGFELCGESQRDITPEFAAAKLRESSPNAMAVEHARDDARHRYNSG